MKTLKFSALALLSTLSLAACDGDGGTGVSGLRQGQFEGEITGVLDIGLAGDAESGEYAVRGEQNLIVLTDFTRGIEITIYDSEGEFRAGRSTIEDEENFNSRLVAYVYDIETGESFGSVSGTLDLDRVRSGGIEGSALFTAESDGSFGDFITVDVIFNTDFTTGIDFNRSPSFSTGEKR